MTYSPGLGNKKLAGEDLTNDALTGQAYSTGFDAIQYGSVAAGSINTSNTIESGRFRKYRVAGYGESGDVTIKVEWSSDNINWQWLNESSADQYPTLVGDINAPYMRVVLTSNHTSAQNVKATVALQT